jgi:hypothetical protein
MSCSALLCLAACDYWHLSVNADGLVFIAVVGDVPARDAADEPVRVNFDVRCA